MTQKQGYTAAQKLSENQGSKQNLRGGRTSHHQEKDSS